MKQNHGDGQIRAVYYILCGGCPARFEPCGAEMHQRQGTGEAAHKAGWRLLSAGPRGPRSKSWFCRGCQARFRAGDAWPFDVKNPSPLELLEARS